MTWVAMIGCGLAVPLAVILGGASAAGLAGASTWLLTAGVVRAIALVVVRRDAPQAFASTRRLIVSADTDFQQRSGRVTGDLGGLLGWADPQAGPTRSDRRRRLPAR